MEFNVMDIRRIKSSASDYDGHDLLVTELVRNQETQTRHTATTLAEYLENPKVNLDHKARMQMASLGLSGE